MSLVAASRLLADGLRKCWQRKHQGESRRNDRLLHRSDPQAAWGLRLTLPSQDVFLVLDQFGERLGRAWRETDENDTDYETLIHHLLEGQCNNPVRVVTFNTDEGWSRDVSDNVADELRDRCAQRGAVPDFLLDFLERHDTDRPVQLSLLDL
jgi:hypothetical protein